MEIKCFMLSTSRTKKVLEEPFSKYCVVQCSFDVKIEDPYLVFVTVQVAEVPHDEHVLLLDDVLQLPGPRHGADPLRGLLVHPVHDALGSSSQHQTMLTQTIQFKSSLTPMSVRTRVMAQVQNYFVIKTNSFEHVPNSDHVTAILSMM